MATVSEQETTVTGYRKGDRPGYHIWTADPVHMRTLDKRVADDRAVPMNRGEDWAEYWVSADLYDPMGGFKRSKPKLSTEERVARGERLRRARGLA